MNPLVNPLANPLAPATLLRVGMHPAYDPHANIAQALAYSQALVNANLYGHADAYVEALSAVPCAREPTAQAGGLRWRPWRRPITQTDRVRWSRVRGKDNQALLLYGHLLLKTFKFAVACSFRGLLRAVCALLSVDASVYEFYRARMAIARAQIALQNPSETVLLRELYGFVESVTSASTRATDNNKKLAMFIAALRKGLAQAAHTSEYGSLDKLMVRAFAESIMWEQTIRREPLAPAAHLCPEWNAYMHLSTQLRQWGAVDWMITDGQFVWLVLEYTRAQDPRVLAERMAELKTRYQRIFQRSLVWKHRGWVATSHDAK